MNDVGSEKWRLNVTMTNFHQKCYNDKHSVSNKNCIIPIPLLFQVENGLKSGNISGNSGL